METLDQIRDFWQSNQEPGTASYNKQEIDKVIKSRIIREKKGIAEYFWVAFVFQVMLYSFACHLTIKYWNDVSISLLCAAGIIMYLPLTVVLMRKFKAMLVPRIGLATDIRTGVENQRKLLQSFFTFKKRFDLVSIPVNSFILVMILFKLYVPGGIEQNLFWSIVSFVLLVLMYAIAAWFENKKHFIQPIERFSVMLEDIKDQRSSQL